MCQSPRKPAKAVPELVPDTGKAKNATPLTSLAFAAVATAAVGATTLYAPRNITSKVADFKGAGSTFEQVLENSAQPAMAEGFYNMATDFYEWGWSQSFHFAPRWASESFDASLVRHEFNMARHLRLEPGMKTVDLGCGVAGPLRNIVRFSRADVTGLTITEYQVDLGNRKIREDGLSSMARVVHGDYHAQPFDNATFARSYDFEASLHSDDLPRYFREIHRTLQPGGRHVGFAYVWADAFDPARNLTHREIAQDYMVGNGCARCYKWAEWEAAMVASGLVLERHEDLAGTTDVPWFARLQPSYDGTVSGLAATPLGMRLTSALTWVMEAMRLAPAGTNAAHELLVRGGRGLRVAGELGLISPIHMYILNKPLEPKVS